MLNTRGVIVAATVVASLLLPISAVKAQPGDASEQFVTILLKKNSTSHQKIYNTTQAPFATKRPAATEMPQGLPTAPEFSPDYHGSNGG
jgi:hypothetical protein